MKPDSPLICYKSLTLSESVSTFVEWKLSYEQSEKKKVKIEKLQEQIVRWQKVEIVRKYIKYFIHSAVQNKHKIKSISNTRKYIEFMKEYADKIDPISDFLEN